MRRSWPVGLLWLALGAPAVAADGQQAFDQGDFRAALAAWSPLAAAGDPRAQLGVGVLYDLGEGVQQSAQTAFRYYLRAAEAGLADAELNVAVMYDSGRGTPRDAAAAALWYARAAANHDHRAEYDLAQLYESGEGVPRNMGLADSWLRAAQQGGLEAAGTRLASRRAQPAAAAPDPVAPTLASPDSAASLERLSDMRSVELVWTAPPEPPGTRYYVEMLAARAGEPPVAAFTTYTDVSAVQAPLLPEHDIYVWRVYAVMPSARRYQPSDWRRFQVIWRGSARAG